MLRCGCECEDVPLTIHPPDGVVECECGATWLLLSDRIIQVSDVMIILPDSEPMQPWQFDPSQLVAEDVRQARQLPEKGTEE